MKRLLWLGIALAMAGAGCSAGGGGSRNLSSSDPIDEQDAGGASGGASSGATGAANGAASGGSNGASTAATTAGGSSGPEICEKVTVRADKVIPDILIVLDKSNSMVWPGCAALVNDPSYTDYGCPNPKPPLDMAYNRWVPSVAALKTTTAALETRVRFGLMIFPSADIPPPLVFGLPFGPPTRCQAGAISVMPALGNAAAIAARLNENAPDGSRTPIPGTLKAAHTALGSGIVGPDKMPTPKYVLLVTDGAPTCTLAGAELGSVADETKAKNESYAEIDSLTKDGIKTYVIGYDTSKTANLATTLNEMAKRGGTGETTHREVTDENSLLAAIDAIAGQVTSCTFQLDQAPPDVNKVRVTIDGIDRANGDGWELSGDRTIELRGQACAEVQNIAIQHTVSINVECKDVIIQ